MGALLAATQSTPNAVNHDTQKAVPKYETNDSTQPLDESQLKLDTAGAIARPNVSDAL